MNDDTLPFTEIITHQDCCLLAVTNLIDIVTIIEKHGGTLIKLLLAVIIRVHLELGFTRCEILCLHQTIVIEEQQGLVTIGLHIL